MVSGNIGSGNPLDAVDRPLRGPAVRMLFAVEQLEQGNNRSSRGIVFILPQNGDVFRSALLDFPLRKNRTADDVEHDRQDPIEILAEARTGDNRRVTRGCNPKRYTTLIEVLSDVIAVALCGPAIEGSPGQER